MTPTVNPEWCDWAEKVLRRQYKELAALRQAAEIVVCATLPLLPLKGSWESGYAVDTASPTTTVSALLSEWAEAAHAVSELHACLPKDYIDGVSVRREQTK